MYYVNDGVYGSFNCLVFDHATVNPEVFGTDKKAEKFPSSIWGPTCDSLDCITKNVLLPKVIIFLIFRFNIYIFNRFHCSLYTYTTIIILSDVSTYMYNLQ